MRRTIGADWIEFKAFLLKIACAVRANILQMRAPYSRGGIVMKGLTTLVVSLIMISDMAYAVTERSPPATSPSITVPLKALATNPNYFTDASGKAVYLTGSHTWNTLQDWGTNDLIQLLDFNAFVKMLVAHHHNFTLLWATELPTFHGFPSTAIFPPDFSVSPHPWQRTGPGIASDGKLKFDLTKFNQAYFNRLRDRVQQLNAAGFEPATSAWKLGRVALTA